MERGKYSAKRKENSMKDAIIIISIIVIIIAGDICTKRYLDKTVDELLESLEALKGKTILAKETKIREEIKKEMENVEQKWETTNKIWSVIVVHQEIDNIEQALTRAKSNINDGELEDALQEIETAIFFSKHVKEREKLSLKNIF